MSMRVLALFPFIAALSGCFGSPSCDTAGVQATLQAVDAAEPPDRAMMLFAGLDQACGGTELNAAKAPADTRFRAAFNDIEANSSAWHAACPGGRSALTELANTADMGGHLHQSCDLGRHGVDVATVQAWDNEALLRITAIGLVQRLDGETKGKVMTVLKSAPVIP